MSKWLPMLFTALVLGIVSSVASAQSFEADVTPLVESFCLRCHGPRTARIALAGSIYCSDRVSIRIGTASWPSCD